MVIKQFLRYLDAEKGYSPKTVVAYTNDLKQFSDFMLTDSGCFLPESIDATDIRRWIISLMDSGISPRSVKRKISTLRSLFKYLKRNGITHNDPVRKIILPKTAKRLPQFVRQEEMEKLLTEIPFTDDFEGIRDKLILEMFYGTGMRLSELVYLRDNHVDMIKKTVIVTGKRNKQRLIPINNNIVGQLQKYFTERDKLFNQVPTLFVTNKGNAIYPKLVYLRVHHYLGMVSTITTKGPHTLRHTFATVLLNNGAELNAVKELLGHSNLAATEVYTHNTFKELSNVYKQAHPRA